MYRIAEDARSAGSLGGELADVRQHLVVFRMTAGGLLGVHESSVHHHLEDSTPRRDDRQLVHLALKFFENPLRQTDGFRRVASLGAILD